MSQRQPLDLERPRDFAGLLSAAVRIYFDNFRTFVAIAAAVVIPVDLIVLGIGLEQLSSGYDESPEAAALLVPLGVSSLITAPLVAAMTVAALLDLGAGRDPSAGASIQRGLDLFLPLLGALLIAAGGVVVGFFLLVLPGIYLAVRWQFVTQSVVVEDARGTGALRRSGELVRGSWWRVFAIVAVAGLIAAIPGGLISLPFELTADSSDRAVFSLVGQVLSEIVTTPFAAVLLTLLYFDLRARHRAALVPAPPGGAPADVSRPPDPPGLPPRS